MTCTETRQTMALAQVRKGSELAAIFWQLPGVVLHKWPALSALVLPLLMHGRHVCVQSGVTAGSCTRCHVCCCVAMNVCHGVWWVWCMWSVVPAAGAAPCGLWWRPQPAPRISQCFHIAAVQAVFCPSGGTCHIRRRASKWSSWLMISDARGRICTAPCTCCDCTSASGRLCSRLQHVAEHRSSSATRMLVGSLVWNNAMQCQVSDTTAESATVLRTSVQVRKPPRCGCFVDDLRCYSHLRHCAPIARSTSRDEGV